MPKPLWAPWRLEYVEQADELPGCIFCAPEEELVLHRGEQAFVLLNRFPYASGHLMVAPLRHVGDYGSLAEEETSSPATQIWATRSAARRRSSRPCCHSEPPSSRQRQR